MLDGKQSSVGKEKACFNERMRFDADKLHIVENGSVLRGQYLVVIEAIISTTNARLLFLINQQLKYLYI